MSTFRLNSITEYTFKAPESDTARRSIAMNKLLEFVIARFSYLYDGCGCKFADSQVHGPNAVLVFETDELRIRFVRDRNQIFVDFQNKRRGAQNRWYSFGVVRQLLSDDASGSEELDADKAQFIQHHFPEIKELFSDANARATEKRLAEFERARGERLFGK